MTIKRFDPRNHPVIVYLSTFCLGFGACIALVGFLIQIEAISMGFKPIDNANGDEINSSKLQNEVNGPRAKDSNAQQSIKDLKQKVEQLENSATSARERFSILEREHQKTKSTAQSEISKLNLKITNLENPEFTVPIVPVCDTEQVVNDLYDALLEMKLSKGVDPRDLFAKWFVDWDYLEANDLMYSIKEYNSPYIDPIEYSKSPSVKCLSEESAMVSYTQPTPPFGSKVHTFTMKLVESRWRIYEFKSLQKK